MSLRSLLDNLFDVRPTDHLDMREVETREREALASGDVIALIEIAREHSGVDLRRYEEDHRRLGERLRRAIVGEPRSRRQRGAHGA